MTPSFKPVACIAAALFLTGCGSDAPDATLGSATSQGTRAAYTLPAMTALDDEVRLSSGREAMAGLHPDGTVYTWGSNQYGQLGQEHGASSLAPVMVQGLSSIIAVESGGYHVAAISTDGSVWTWGNNTYGQLGFDAGLSRVNSTPTLVRGVTNVTAIAAGYAHTAALTRDGALWGWGSMPGHVSATPVRVQGVPVAVKKVSAGNDFILALGVDDAVYAWGGNGSGQLGNGQQGAAVIEPIRVAGLSQVLAISAGNSHALALRADGTIWAWGGNHHGQLGTDANDTRLPQPVRGLPTPLAGASAVKTIVAGERNSAVVYRDGSVWIWGSNSQGQFGNSTTSGSSVPVRINGAGGMAAVSVGDGFVSVLLSDGRVFGMGANQAGQLGNNSMDASLVQVQVVGLSAVGHLSLGASAAP